MMEHFENLHITISFVEFLKFKQKCFKFNLESLSSYTYFFP